MSWLISAALMNSLYSQEQEAEFSEENCLDGEPFAQLNVMPTPHKFWRNDKTMEFLNLSRFGLTCKILTDDRGEELLTLYLGAFHARILASQERGPELPESAAECGLTWRASLARFDLDTSSWKTVQLSLLGDSELSSVIWPRSGMTANGQCWELPVLARRTSGTGSGCWATHLASMGERGGRGDLLMQVEGNESPSGRFKIPKWPTPTAHMAKETNAPSEALRNEPSLSSRVGGKLNPEWVEKLMGWSGQWTSLNNISHVNMCFWFMGFCDEEDRRKSEVLRMLRIGHASEEVRREIGRPVGIQETAFLLADMCEYQNRPDEARIFMACAQALEEEMRGMRLCESTSSAPYRPGQGEQRTREHTDLMQALSRLLAHHGAAAWKSGCWEDGIPRVADGVGEKLRADRLKAIGNGQVPRVAAAAFELLNRRLIKGVFNE